MNRNLADWTLELALDVRLWLRNGPRGYASLLSAWAEQRIQIDDLTTRLGAANRQSAASTERADRLRHTVDDLATRPYNDLSDLAWAAGVVLDQSADEIGPDCSGTGVQSAPARQDTT